MAKSGADPSAAVGDPMPSNAAEVSTHPQACLEMSTSSSPSLQPPLKKLRHSVVPRTLCLVFDSAARSRVMLITYSASKGGMAGKRNFLGGHIEAGEDGSSSALREVREEAGLEPIDIDAASVRVAGVVHVAKFFGKAVMMFVVEMCLAATASETTLDPKRTYRMDKGVVEWFEVVAVPSLAVFPDIPPLMERCLRDQQTFTARCDFTDTALLNIHFNRSNTPCRNTRWSQVVQWLTDGTNICTDIGVQNARLVGFVTFLLAPWLPRYYEVHLW